MENFKNKTREQLVEKIEVLNKRVLTLETEKTECKRVEEELIKREKEEEYLKNIRLLSETAMKFVELSSDENIYHFIGEQLKKITGKGTVVIINSINGDKSILTTEVVSGLGKFTKKITELIGRNVTGITYDAKDENLTYLNDGKLHLYQEGLYGIFLKTIPKVVCNSIEKLASLEKIYTIGFTKDKKLFGTCVIFITQNAEDIKDHETIEIFIKQASIAIRQRQAEQELKAKSQFLERLIQQSPLPTFVLDAKGICIMLNEAFLNFYSIPDKNLILGRNSLKEPVNIKYGVDKHIKKALEGKIVKVPEIEFISPFSDNPIYVTSKLFPIFDPSGNLTNVVVMHEDITERKQAEEELNKHREHLEELVKERTTELEEKNDKLKYFNKLFVGREFRIKELRDKVKELEEKISDPPEADQISDI